MPPSSRIPPSFIIEIPNYLLFTFPFSSMNLTTSGDQICSSLRCEVKASNVFQDIITVRRMDIVMSALSPADSHSRRFAADFDSKGKVRSTRVPRDPLLIIEAHGIAWFPTYMGYLLCGNKTTWIAISRPCNSFNSRLIFYLTHLFGRPLVLEQQYHYHK